MVLLICDRWVGYQVACSILVSGEQAEKNKQTRKKKKKNLQPVNLRVMCELVYKLINDTVDTHRPTNQLKFRVFRIRENKVVLVELRKASPSNPSR